MATAVQESEVEVLPKFIMDIDPEKFRGRLAFVMASGRINDFGIASHDTGQTLHVVVLDAESNGGTIHPSVRGWQLKDRNSSAVWVFKHRLRPLTTREKVALKNVHEKLEQGIVPEIHELPSWLLSQ
ncbi:MAG: hypothetical protein WC631_00175 [Candidatus Paceibacterota bacterium]|jgi:hypothetical protein